MRTETIIRTGLLLAILVGAALAGAAFAEEAEPAITLEALVDARAEVSRVYYTHRHWPWQNPGPRPSFEEAVPRTSIRAAIEEARAKTRALEALWGRTITATDLQAEMDRMARDSREPARLRELFEALGDDPLLIAEVFVRPRVVDEELRRLYFEDHPQASAVDFDAWWETTRSQYDEPRVASGDDSRARVDQSLLGPCAELEVVDAGDLETPVITGYAGCTADSWDPMTTLNSDPSDPDAPTARAEGVAVWTGNEMIVWGGREGNARKGDGSAYDPATDAWTPLPATDAPSPRYGMAGVFTGNELIIWGGHGLGGNYLNDGSILSWTTSPSDGTWTALATEGAPSGRSHCTAVWTGTEMIVWGGYHSESGYPSSGGQYDPAAGTWTPTENHPSSDVPIGRTNHSAVWTGREMVIWGGRTGQNLVRNDGASYDPDARTWTPTRIPNAPSARADHTAVWMPGETQCEGRMIVWGGRRKYSCGDLDYLYRSDFFDQGGRYDSCANAWSTLDVAGAPEGRAGHGAVWTGTEMIIWGGYRKWCDTTSPQHCNS